MKKIRVAFIISNLGQGGAERQFSYLINNVDKSRFEITTFLYACQTEPFYNDIENNKNIVLLKQKLTTKFSFLKILEAIINIRSFLIKNEFDVVVTFLFMNNFLVRLASPKTYYNKIVCSVRTSIKMYSKVHIVFEKLQMKKSILVFNSQKTANEFKKIFKVKYLKNTCIIYNGFLEIDNINRNNKNEYTFGCLGRLDKQKNFLQVAKIFNEIGQLNRENKLIIQGHFGDQYDEIINLGSLKNIELNEANPNVETFFSSINTLVLPSLSEGCPNVLFEALLRKKLCIISEGANTDGFIVDGMNGYVYDGSDKGLEVAMNNAVMISGNTKEKLIIENGYKYAKENFSMKVMISKYEELFKTIYENN